MAMIRTELFACCMAAGVGLLAGCGGPVAVDGVVTLDGRPLPDASVIFVPEGAGRSAATMTDAEGFFRFNPRSESGRLLPGAYRVIISKLDVPPPPENAVPGIPSPQKNYDPMITERTLEKLKHARSKSGVPTAYTDSSTTPLRVEVLSSGNKQLLLELQSEPE